MDFKTFGSFTAYRGKLSNDDARSAYVTGPTISGRIAPLASFWYFEDAVRWAKEQHELRDNKKPCECTEYIRVCCPEK